VQPNPFPELRALSDHDRQFYDRFVLVLGILIGISVFLFVIARMAGVGAQTENFLQDPAYQAAVEERILPVARVAIAGEDFVDEAAQVVQVEAVHEVMSGPQVYNVICGSCHSSGLAGAPKTGDQSAWGPRIAQGMGTLNKNALEGLQTTIGFMPPKGGRLDLSDEEILAAVQYMVDQVN